MSMNLVPTPSEPTPNDLPAWRSQYAPRLLGEDPSIVSALEDVRQVAASCCSVTILGESGTGKELVARAIHDASPRAAAPMISINCGAISDALIESELFGHTRGAFTGADRSRPGLFEAAHRGTLFLDEVAELSADAQTKLLRVIQEGEIRPVGSMETKRVDVRIIAASHVDLEQAVAEGRFREDLFYRLSVIPIELPPLREREGDLELLITRFIEKFNDLYASEIQGVDGSFLAQLADYPWPGNIRELENLVNRLVVMKREGTLSGDDLPKKFKAVDSTFDSPTHRTQGPDPGLGQPIELQSAVRNFERDLIDRALAWAGGNKSKAARLLSMRRTTLVAKIQKFIDMEDHSAASESALGSQNESERTWNGGAPIDRSPLDGVHSDDAVLSTTRNARSIGTVRPSPSEILEEIRHAHWGGVASLSPAG